MDVQEKTEKLMPYVQALLLLYDKVTIEFLKTIPPDILEEAGMVEMASLSAMLAANMGRNLLYAGNNKENLDNLMQEAVDSLKSGILEYIEVALDSKTGYNKKAISN